MRTGYKYRYASILFFLIIAILFMLNSYIYSHTIDLVALFIFLLIPFHILLVVFFGVETTSNITFSMAVFLYLYLVLIGNGDF